MATTPTLSQLLEALADPSRNLRTLRDAQLLTAPDGSPQLTRTSLMAEVRILREGRRYLLQSPLSAVALHQAERVAPRLKYAEWPWLAECRLLPDELTYRDAAGEARTGDLLLEAIPAGEPLDRAVASADRDRLLAALDTLEEAMREAGFSHRNLKPSNLYLAPDYRLCVVRPLYARFDTRGRGDNAAQIDALRDFVRRRAAVAQMMCDTAAEYGTTAPQHFAGHRWTSSPFEQLLCVEDETGYGFVDLQNRPVIAAQYRWAGDFREGRAEVETFEGRMGLIDKTGRYVIPPLYEIVEYDDRSGRSLVRLDGRWAIFDYAGAPLCAFGETEPQSITEH